MTSFGFGWSNLLVWRLERVDGFVCCTVVPASLAYGDRGAGDVIPPGSTLLFDIVIGPFQN
jgi:hypothetical protein